MGTQRLQNHMKTFFGGHPNIRKEGLLEKMFAQTVAQKVFGQVWGNSGKNPSHPQKIACSYTYVSYRFTYFDIGLLMRRKSSNPTSPDYQKIVRL